MKIRPLIQFAALLVLAAVIAVILFQRRPPTAPGSVSVSFLSLTNDATGRRSALFLASNNTARLFVRGRSELELQIGASNIVSVVQLTNVNYLKPAAGITFAVPCDGWTNPWRLNFHYIGQFDRREAIVYEAGWSLQSRRMFPEWCISWLPKHEEYKLNTRWVSNSMNAR